MFPRINQGYFFVFLNSIFGNINMSREINLTKIIKQMKPVLNEGEFVFTTVDTTAQILREDVICEFKEAEGTTLVLERAKADELNLAYNYIASWITLKVHSSLDAVGLTALFSTELAKHNISCNVIAGYYHDHIFVAKNDAIKAIDILKEFSKNYNSN
jgi:hypothetical protein